MSNDGQTDNAGLSDSVLLPFFWNFANSSVPNGTADRSVLDGANLFELDVRSSFFPSVARKNSMVTHEDVLTLSLGKRCKGKTR